MAVINRLVTEFLFKGNIDKLEKYQKSLNASKKSIEEFKKAQKDLNKFYVEEERKIQDKLKSLSISDFTSAKTKKLRKSLADIKDAIETERLKDKPNRLTIKSLKRDERDIKNKLKASEAKDAKEAEKAITATKKQFKDTQKNHRVAMAQAEEKIETEKESQEATKEKVEEEKKSMQTVGLALGRFTMALGIASVAIGGAIKAFNFARDTIGKYQEGAYGTGMGEDEFVRLRNALSTMTGVDPDKMGQSLTSFFSKVAEAKKLGGSFLSELGVAGVNVYDTPEETLANMREQWKAGKLDEDLLRAKGIDTNLFRFMDSNLDFQDTLSKTAYGATREQNKAKAETLGKVGHAKRNFTALAGGGRMPSNTSSINEYSDYIKTQGQPEITWANALKAGCFGGNGDANITQNNTYNINTNNPDVADKFIEDKKVLKSLSIGGGD